MQQIKSLVNRNIKIFLRDKTAVFFSFLSVIILITLYFLFIRNSYISGFEEFLVDDKVTNFLVTSQMMGGVLVINTLTLSLGMMGNMVNDIYYRKMESFLVTPVRRYKIFLSYYISTIIVTYVLSLVMWLVTIIYVLATTGYLYSIGTILIIAALLLLYTFISTSIMLFVISFIKSVNAFGTISGVFGTLVGFVSGIYMPLTILPKAMKYISSAMPFTHMAIYLKQQLMVKPYSLVKDIIPAEAFDELQAVFGTEEIGLFGLDISMIWVMIGIGVLTITLLAITMKRLSRKSK